MANPDDEHDQRLVADLVQHAMVTDPEPPDVVVSRQLDGADGARIERETSDPLPDPDQGGPWQPLELASGCREDL